MQLKRHICDGLRKHAHNIHILVLGISLFFFSQVSHHCVRRSSCTTSNSKHLAVKKTKQKKDEKEKKNIIHLKKTKHTSPNGRTVRII